MRSLARALRLRDGLTRGQRAVAVVLLVYGMVGTVICFVAILVLANMGSPSVLPWFAWVLFGLGPFLWALEEYGPRGEESEDGEADLARVTPIRREEQGWGGSRSIG